MSTTSNEDNLCIGCLEIVCQMPVRSKVMLVPADCLGVDFTELFKTASEFVLRWWLQFRILIGYASRKKLKLVLYHHVYLETHRHCGTPTGDSDGVLLVRINDRLLSVQW